MSDDTDSVRFQNLLDAALAYNTNRDNRPGGRYEMIPEYPITFYDRHLDSDLTLKQVRIAPSMVRLLSDVCDEQIRALHAAGKTRCYEKPAHRRGPTFTTSWDVAAAYQESLGEFCLLFPSKLFFHPHYQDLFSVFEYQISQMSTHRPTFLTEAYLSVRFPFYNCDKPDYVPEEDTHVKEDSLANLRELGSHSPQLAIWDFYPMNMYGEKLLKQMGEIPNFSWDVPHTIAQHNNIHTPARFADDQTQDNFGGKLKNESTLASRREIRKRSPPQKAARTTRKQESGVVPPSPWWPMRTGRPYRVKAAHFLQHGWARAVANDATFIVFNCGKYERIGFRHRASRTLYLSELIETATCQNPAYGRLHIGLYFALVQDAVNRQRLRLRLTSMGKLIDTGLSPMQHKHASESNPKKFKPHKRQKVKVEKVDSAKVDEDDSSGAKAVFAALSDRNLALVCLTYGVFQSTIPSSFIRREPSCAPGFHQRSLEKSDQKAKYRPHQYVTLTLSQSIDKGATGTIHRALATIQLESGVVVHHPLIIKLVFLDRETRPKEILEGREETEEERLYNEYAVYQHLASAGVVEGILPVYGLFEDVDSGTLALIMEDGGTSLKRREYESTGAAKVITVISQAERDLLLRTLKKIHESGLRHRDIRTENIVVDSKGGTFIIDFDRAEFVTFPSESLDRELSCLQNIVDGRPSNGSYYSF